MQEEAGQARRGAYLESLTLLKTSRFSQTELEQTKTIPVRNKRIIARYSGESAGRARRWACGIPWCKCIKTERRKNIQEAELRSSGALRPSKCLQYASPCAVPPAFVVLHLLIPEEHFGSVSPST